jgi:hypothetical membrane protein
MGAVTAQRLRWGAIAWLLTLQFFVAETVVALRQDGRYSYADDVISALGASTSPGAQLMNASFVLQGALILAGALALRPLLRGTPGRVAVVLLGAAAVGALLVGVFPLDGTPTAHQVGAGLYFPGSTLGLVALAYALRRRSEAVGTVLALLGLIGVAATVFFFTGVTSLAGVGGTERAAAYVLPLGLALAGAALWRLGGAPAAAGTPTARERARAERDRARAERAERDRERDAALEAKVRRPVGTPAAARTAHPADADPDDADPDDADPDDGDPDTDDPWSTPARRTR